MNEKIDWKEVVAKSNGAAVFLPAALKPKMDEIEEKRKDLNKKLMALSREEIVISKLSNDLYYEFREYMEKNGHPDIWQKEIMINVNAREAGVYVLQINEQQGKTL